MRSVLQITSFAMLLVAFVGCVDVAFAFVGWYMVAAGYVHPGQPMYLDELAPSYQDVLYQLLFGAFFIAVALVSRATIRRSLSTRGA